MTDGILLCGKRGSGKSLIAVSMIRDYMRRGNAVATNLNLNVEHLSSPKNKVRPFRLPDFPTIEDLTSLDLGNPGLELDAGGDVRLKRGFTEEKNGLLVLDEVATFLNSRSWQDKNRGSIISWLLQSRKFGWDIVMIAQHPRLVDAQVRDSLFDLFGTVRRLDKISIPVLGNFFAAAGLKLQMPRIHACALRYGNLPHAPISSRIFTRGGDLYQCYDTTQKIDPEVGVKTGEGFYYLSAWDVVGRHMGFWKMYRSAFIALFVVGGLVGFVSGKSYEASQAKVSAPVVASENFSKVPALGLVKHAGTTQVEVFIDGRLVTPDAYRQTLDGWQVKVGDVWYKGISP